jgi:hypothetical protein
VGFYGGINYGFGYFGNGYDGGRWDNGHFFYNQSYSQVNVSINRNVYNTRVENTTINRVSFNGGSGGVQLRATAQKESFANERHMAPVAAQTEHVQSARANAELRASANNGKPPIAATAKAGAFKESGAVAAKKVARFTPPLPQQKTMHILPPMRIARAPQSTPRTFSQRNALPLQTKTDKNTSSNRTNSRHNRLRNARHSRQNKSRIINACRKSRLMNRSNSLSSRSINSRRSNSPRSTPSSNNSCSSVSNPPRTRPRPSQQKKASQAPRSSLTHRALLAESASRMRPRAGLART